MVALHVICYRFKSDYLHLVFMKSLLHKDKKRRKLYKNYEEKKITTHYLSTINVDSQSQNDLSTSHQRHVILSTCIDHYFRSINRN